MSVGPELEAPQGAGEQTDAVTFSFADVTAGLYGLARLGLSGQGSERSGSALAVLFSGREPVAAIAEGDVEVAPDADFSALALPGLGASVDVPLERWSVRMAGEAHGFALTFEATSPPAACAPVGGMTGYEQLCSVTGQATLDGETRTIDGTGQRGHTWGAADWRRLGAVHSVSAWLGDGRGVALTRAHADGDKGHDSDERWGAILLGADGAAEVADARLSTTYDAEGRQRRAGLELWLDEDDEGDAPSYPHRAAGTLLCGSSLDLGLLRLDCAFMRWTMEGEVGVGRYDVLRRAS